MSSYVRKIRACTLSNFFDFQLDITAPGFSVTTIFVFISFSSFAFKKKFEQMYELIYYFPQLSLTQLSRSGLWQFKMSIEKNLEDGGTHTLMPHHKCVWNVNFRNVSSISEMGGKIDLWEVRSDKKFTLDHRIIAQMSSRYDTNYDSPQLIDRFLKK